MLTSQRKLMATLIGLVVLATVFFGVTAERSLRSDQVSQVEASLLDRARMVKDRVAEIPFTAANSERLDQIADRAGEAGGMRVTLIGRDGWVLGDSSLSLSSLAKTENHRLRPEVLAALEGRLGEDTRRSETVRNELLYLALPDAERKGVVRVAVALADLDSARTILRQRLALAGGIGILVSVLLSYLVARAALRPIHELRRVAAALARGELDERPPLSEGDELGEIANAIREIASQLREGLEEATREKEQLRAVLESMVEGVLVIDADANVILANSQLRNFYSVPPEITGRALLEAIRDPDLHALLEQVEASDGIVSSTLKRGDPERTLRVQAARFPRGDAPRNGSVAVFHDISELERLEEVRRDFVANASHELRTPLTAIQGFAETLLDSDLGPADQRSYLEIIDRHARRLGHIVRDLLAISTVETGKWNLDPVRLDVAVIARDLVQDFAPRAVEAELLLDFEVESDVDGADRPNSRPQAESDQTQAFADPRILEQILVNLLENAIKYTEAGGRIQLRVQGQADRVRIAVSDTGIGIPEEDVARIFERFYRVDRARSRSAGGTGLGLSIVRHMVQRSGGEISVESELGVGSTFAFGLPKHAPPREPSDDPQQLRLEVD
ncbi:MAG: ATP-binding protein [Myxococcota bacterium]